MVSVHYFSANILAVAVLQCFSFAYSIKLPPIYWNSSNPMFLMDNTDHVLTVRLRDTLDIYCPHYNVTDTREVEYSLIYLVSKFGYDNCVLEDKSVLAYRCDLPYGEDASIMKLVFRPFSPLPGAIEFEENKTYHFISTSDGSRNGASNKKGGLCLERNMRMKIEVKPGDDSVFSTPNKIPASQDDDEVGHRQISNKIFATGRLTSSAALRRKLEKEREADAISSDEANRVRNDQELVKFIDDNKSQRSEALKAGANKKEWSKFDSRAAGDADDAATANTFLLYQYADDGGSVKRDYQSTSRYQQQQNQKQQNGNSAIVLYEVEEVNAQEIGRYINGASKNLRQGYSSLFFASLSIMVSILLLNSRR